MSESELPWYRDGLKFECTRCGACCTGAPGYVWVGIEEVTRLAEHRKLAIDDFGRTYLRQVGDDLSLIEKPNGDCIFWDAAQGCTVYTARPEQCRTWPFWPENLETPDDWARTCKVCPGSGQGPVYSLDSIASSLARSPK